MRRKIRPANGKSIVLAQRHRLRHRADAAEHHLVVDEIGRWQQHLISWIEQCQRGQRKCLITTGGNDHLVWCCIDPVTLKEPGAQLLSERNAPRIGRVDVYIAVKEAVVCRANRRLRWSKMRQRLPEIDDRVSFSDKRGRPRVQRVEARKRHSADTTWNSITMHHEMSSPW